MIEVAEVDFPPVAIEEVEVNEEEGAKEVAEAGSQRNEKEEGVALPPSEEGVEVGLEAIGHSPNSQGKGSGRTLTLQHQQQQQQIDKQLHTHTHLSL